ARRGAAPRRPASEPGRGPCGGHPIVGVGPSVGLGRGVPERRRSRPGALGSGLLRPQLRPAGPGQDTLRPSQPVPVPAVTPPTPLSTPRPATPDDLGHQTASSPPATKQAATSSSSHPKAESWWYVLDPEVMYWAPRHLQSIWGARSIFITENGCAAADVAANDGRVYDTDR